MKKWLIKLAAALLLGSSVPASAQNVPILNMGFSGAGIGADLLKVIERNGLWRKNGIDVRTIYLSSGTLMAQTLSSGDIGVAGFDTPAMLSLALAGNSLKIIAVPINRLEPLFVVRSTIKTPTDLKGKKVAISRFGSGSDIMTISSTSNPSSRKKPRSLATKNGMEVVLLAAKPMRTCVSLSALSAENAVSAVGLNRMNESAIKVAIHLSMLIQVLRKVSGIVILAKQFIDRLRL